MYLIDYLEGLITPEWAAAAGRALMSGPSESAFQFPGRLDKWQLGQLSGKDYRYVPPRDEPGAFQMYAWTNDSDVRCMIEAIARGGEVYNTGVLVSASGDLTVKVAILEAARQAGRRPTPAQVRAAKAYFDSLDSPSDWVVTWRPFFTTIATWAAIAASAIYFAPAGGGAAGGGSSAASSSAASSSAASSSAASSSAASSSAASSGILGTGYGTGISALDGLISGGLAGQLQGALSGGNNPPAQSQQSSAPQAQQPVAQDGFVVAGQHFTTAQGVGLLVSLLGVLAAVAS